MAEAPWLAVARALIGVRETPGTANNPIIMGWAAKLGVAILGIAYTADSTPWCGLFVAHCMKEVGIQPPKIAIRAKAWATWGIGVTPCLGAVLVFEREGGGHVGLYAGEDETHFYVAGGNQGDKVSITRIEKARRIACRWPADRPLDGAKPLRLTAAGVPVSRSEA